jgi:CYTH domain-containing protein
MDNGGVEIERKYLLSGAPSEAELAALGARAARIEQVYLRGSDGWVRRVRRIEAQGAARYVLTRKRDREGIARDEIERELSLEEYGHLVAEADPDRRVIRKVRHTFPHARWTLELDVFSEPPGLVLLEVELDDPADVPQLPAGIQALVVREVSTEPAFTNHALALRPGAAAGPRPGAAAAPAGS